LIDPPRLNIWRGEALANGRGEKKKREGGKGERSAGSNLYHPARFTDYLLFKGRKRERKKKKKKGKEKKPAFPSAQGILEPRPAQVREGKMKKKKKKKRDEVSGWRVPTLCRGTKEKKGKRKKGKGRRGRPPEVFTSL